MDLTSKTEGDSRTISRRQRIISELYSTETTYVKHLSTLHESFYIPLLKAANDSSPIIPLEDVQTIFQNLEPIVKINSTLLKNMHARINQDNFSFDTSPFTDIFLEIFADEDTPLQLEYQNYINNYENSINCLNKNTKNPGVKEFMDQALKRCNFTSIKSYLITPVQRLPRYILMLQDLNKYTPDDHIDKNNVKQAVESILHITQQIESGKNFYQELLRKEVILQRFSPIDQETIQTLVLPQDIIIVESPLSLIQGNEKPSSRIVILTSNHIIVSRKSRVGEGKLRLCNCLSLLSCEVSFKDTQIILTLMERADDTPFLKQSKFYFTTKDKSTYELWETSLQSIKGLIDPHALLDRASITRRQLQSLLVSSFLGTFAIGAEKFEFPNTGSTLVREGKLQKHLLYIERGSIDVFKEIRGHQVCITTMIEGDLIGDISFLNSLKIGKNCLATATLVTAEPNTSILKISFDVLVSSLCENNDLAWKFYFLLAASIGERILRINSCVSQQTYVLTTCKELELQRRRSQRALSLNLSKGKNSPRVELRTPRNSSGPMTPRNATPPGHMSQSGTFGFQEKVTLPITASKSHGSNIAYLEKISRKYQRLEKSIGEPILQEFPGKFRVVGKKRPFHGYLLLSSTHVCLFQGKIFGKNTQIIISGVGIEHVQLSDDKKTVTMNYLTSDLSGERVGIKESSVLMYLNEVDATLAAKSLKNYILGIRSTSHWQKIEKLASFDVSKNELFSAEKEFRRNDVIVEPRKLANRIYQVVSGRCRVEIESNGQRHVVGSVEVGETVCELGFLLGTVTGAYVIADSTCAVIVECSWETLEHIAEIDLPLAVQFYKYLAHVLCKRFISIERKISAPKLKEARLKISGTTSPDDDKPLE